MALLPDLVHADLVDLRRWEPDQASALLDAVEASIAELRPWMPWAAVPPTEDGLRARLTEGVDAFDGDEEWTYTVAEPGAGRVLGSVGVHRRGDAATVEIGYWIRTDVTGRGYATMCARALTATAFTHLPWVLRTEIRMDEANHRSAAVPRRLGYRLDREVDREIVAPAESGRGLVWVMERSRFEAPTGHSAG
ncbi:MAG: GNAT family protein [Acidimicrobiales bacterium]